MQIKHNVIPALPVRQAGCPESEISFCLIPDALRLQGLQ